MQREPSAPKRIVGPADDPLRDVPARFVGGDGEFEVIPAQQAPPPPPARATFGVPRWTHDLLRWMRR